MFEIFSKNTHHQSEGDKHDLTIVDNEIFDNEKPVEKTDNFHNLIVHIFGDIDHLHLDGSHTIIVHGNIVGNVRLTDNSWLTCETIHGDVKYNNPQHLEVFNNEKDNKEDIICS